MVPESILTETRHNLICTEESIEEDSTRSRPAINLNRLCLLQAKLGLVVSRRIVGSVKEDVM